MNARFWPTLLAILQKDLRAEIRSREILATMLLFTLLSVIVFSFALQLDVLARRSAVAGVLWVTVIFSSILGLNRSMVIERENETMNAMLLAPVSRTAIFLGKLISNGVIVLIVGTVLLPLMTVLYNINLVQPWLFVTLLLGILGISISGTLLSAMTTQTRAREALLPIVMMPLVLPLLLAAVSATNGILDAQATRDQWFLWVQVLAVVDLIYLVLCTLTFSSVVEE